jgi:hypothetical protein
MTATNSPTVLTVAAGVADVTAIRQETFRGRVYTVVPVVAICEGVLHGANSSGPEFAGAAEFGKFPDSWNGRPVVLDHPQVNGLYVSANIPTVLQDYAFGFMFSTRLEDSKLKTEAWLDNDLIAEMGGEFESTLTRINSGETVEVSVGAYIEVVAKPGTFGAKAYDGVWTNVVPDHLAFLPAGITGACSVADGCGVPRLNSANHVQPAKALVGAGLNVNNGLGLYLRHVAPIGETVHDASTPCCDACANKGTNMTTNATSTIVAAGGDLDGQISPAPKTNAGGSPAFDTLPKVKPGTTPPIAEITATPNNNQPMADPTMGLPVTPGMVDPAASNTGEEYDVQDGLPSRDVLMGALTPPSGVSGLPVTSTMASVLRSERRAELLQELVVNAVPNSITLDNAETLIYQALQEVTGADYYDLDILAMTTDTVVFYQYGTGCVYMQVGYSIAADGAVTLIGEPSPVNLLTTITPRQATILDSGVTENTPTMNSERNGNMTGTTATAAEAAAGPGTTAAPAPANFSDLLASAPAAFREQYERGVRMHNNAVEAHVKALMASPKNKFTEEQLRGFNLDQLEGMSSLAEVGDFSGIAAPVADFSANSAPLSAFAAANNDFLGANPVAATVN